MTYSKSGSRFAMSCDHVQGCNGKHTYVYNGPDDLEGYRKLWSTAPKGWTSTSTKHICPSHKDD